MKKIEKLKEIIMGYISNNTDSIRLTQLLNLGDKYYNLNRLNKSIHTFTKAIEEFPNDYNAILSRGIVYAEKKEYEKAISDFNRANELKPNDLEILSNLADTYKQTKRYSDALATLVQYNKIEPDNYGIYMEIKEIKELISDEPLIENFPSLENLFMKFFPFIDNKVTITPQKPGESKISVKIPEFTNTRGLSDIAIGYEPIQEPITTNQLKENIKNWMPL